MDPAPDVALKERLASLNRALNVLAHADWRDLYLRLADDAAAFQREMDAAPNWDTFITARALRQYLDGYLMKLPEIVKSEIEQIEIELAVEGQPLSPTDYELD